MTETFDQKQLKDMFEAATNKSGLSYRLGRQKPDESWVQYSAQQKDDGNYRLIEKQLPFGEDHVLCDTYRVFSDDKSPENIKRTIAALDHISEMESEERHKKLDAFLALVDSELERRSRGYKPAKKPSA
mgnify:CR=1 FL=1